MDISWIPEYTDIFLRGLKTTLSLTLISGVLGFILAFAVGLARISSWAIVRNTAWFFTSMVRGTPLLIQLYLIYYGLGELFQSIPEIRQSIFWPYLRSGYWYVIFALTLSVGGYVGEVMRAGFLAVPAGELQAAEAFGYTRWKAFIRIQLPRALGILKPNLIGESILHLKSTSLASTIAVMDLLGAATRTASRTFIVY